MAAPVRGVVREVVGGLVRVVAGVILDGRGQVLIAKRPDHLHQGGLWEFPGGKIEAEESARQALQRELLEELGIEVAQCKPLLQVTHSYADKEVALDFWEVSAFSGVVSGRESQQICWVALHQLSEYEFPAANRAVVRMLCDGVSGG